MQNISILHFPVLIRPSLKWVPNAKILCMFSFFTVLVLFIYALFQVNSIVQNTYLLQDYENTLEELSEENSKLGVQFSQLNSLENLEVLIQDLDYEKVNRIKYIRILEGQVVVK